jgi:hypothetical protein
MSREVARVCVPHRPSFIRSTWSRALVRSFPAVESKGGYEERALTDVGMREASSLPTLTSSNRCYCNKVPG